MTDRRGFLKRSGLVAGTLILPERQPAAGAGSPDDSRPAGAVPGGPDLPLISKVEPHAFIAQVRCVIAAMESLGTPLSAEDMQALRPIFAHAGPTEAIQRVLDRSCLIGVHINPELRVKVARGPTRPKLAQHGWRSLLVKVHNESGTTAALRAMSDQPPRRWLDVLMFDEPPLTRSLSGLDVEYRIMRLYSHEAGRREASLAFNVGQGTQDLGFRNELPVLFDCWPAH